MLIIGVLSGCGYARVTVVPPQLDETEASREAAWRDFQSVGVIVEETVQLRPGKRDVLSSNLDAVKLGNGTLVSDPRDLIPLVPGSHTAELATRWGAGNDRLLTHLWIGLGTFGAGLTALLTLVASGPSSGLDRGVGTGLVISSLALMGLGPLVNVILGAIFVGPIDQLRIEAFQRYDADLGARLLSR
jgi:hypothetical protein